ncbi:uroplakin-3b-like protein 1 isoform X2 [Ranitomeya imitator]|uniref:uroplakin-3b-like protein 1 isoform X2 n=1 Tax=Ranitomeya imitator TaxID=111125 RepID=UPI0037E97DB9
MDLLLKLGLLLLGVTATLAEVRYYVPQVTTKPLLGRLTNNSFALDQPQCIFNLYNTTDVWLVVALNSVVPKLTEYDLSTPYDYKLFPTKHYYHIYQQPAAKYPCADTVPEFKALIPVGIEMVCGNVSFCNGILTENGPYRVKFVLLNNTTLTRETRWSEKFNLITGMNKSTIDTGPGRRSAGMIVIVVILSVLLAILLAFLIAAIAVGSKDICWCRTLDNEGFLVKEELDLDDYNIPPYRPHSIYMTHSKWLQSQQNRSTVYTVFK